MWLTLIRASDGPPRLWRSTQNRFRPQKQRVGYRELAIEVAEGCGHEAGFNSAVNRGFAYAGWTSDADSHVGTKNWAHRD